MNGYFFYLDWMWEAGRVGRLARLLHVAMLFFVVGFWAATIYKRFGASVILTIVLVGDRRRSSSGSCGSSDAWTPGPQVFAWFGQQGAGRAHGCGALLLGAVLAAISFLTLRRAVP